MNRGGGGVSRPSSVGTFPRAALLGAERGRLIFREPWVLGASRGGSSQARGALLGAPATPGHAEAPDAGRARARRHSGLQACVFREWRTGPSCQDRTEESRTPVISVTVRAAASPVRTERARVRSAARGVVQ